MIARADLSHLKWSALFLLLSLGVSIAIALYGDTRLTQAQAAEREARQQLAQTKRLTESAANERDDGERHQAAYEALLADGHIDTARDDDEAQLRRTAEMERLYERYLLPRFDYMFQAYRPFSEGGNHFEVGIQHAQLQFSLRHEGQLFRVLDELRDDGYVVERCRIERDGDLLNAACDGGWVSLRKREAK